MDFDVDVFPDVSQLGQDLMAVASKPTFQIPAYPDVAVRIAALVERNNHDVKDLAALVNSDPAVAAAVMRCACSAYYGTSLNAPSLPAAIMRIGSVELARVALAASLNSAALAQGPLVRLRRRAWQDSVGSAFVAHELARAVRVPADEAFLAALLHDFGRIVAVNALEAVAERLPEVRAMPEAFWDAVVDQHHVMLGGVLAERWKLPPLIAAVMTQHHSPIHSAAPPQGLPGLLALVGAADALWRLLDSSSTVSAEDLLRVPYVRDHGVDASRLLGALMCVPGAVEALCTTPEARQRGRSRPALVLQAPPTVETSSSNQGAVVQLKHAGQIHAFALQGVAHHGMRVLGKQRVPERQLLCCTLRDDLGDLQVWCNVAWCSAVGGQWELELKLMATGADANKRWTALVRKSQPQAPAA